MTSGVSNDGGPSMNLQAAIGEINRLKAKMATIEQEKGGGEGGRSRVGGNTGVTTSYSGSMGSPGTQTTIIGAEDHLRCKLLSSTFKDAALRWYMNLPRHSISSCADFHKKSVHQFAGTKHVQVTATSLLSIRQNGPESLREYLAHFSEATIKVSNPNQEMFVAAFQNGLKAGHFNESLAQKPAESMQEVMKRAECYIKGEESNAEKRSRDSRERGGNKTPDRYQRGWQPRDREAHSDFSQIPNLSFSPNDVSGIVPHDDDPLVIQEAFKAMQVASEQLRPYHGTLVGFTDDQAEVMGHITLLTTFGDHQNAKTVKVRYLVVKTPFASYNIIIGRPAFNTLGAAMSTLYLYIKYPLDNGGVGIVRGDQALGRQCYESSLKVRKNYAHGATSQTGGTSVNTTNMSEAIELDPREEFHEGRVSPIEDLEEITIGSEPHQVTNIGTTLPPEEKDKVIETLRRNVDLFAWHPKHMPGIDESIITHKLAIHPDAKPVSQQKRKVGEERRSAIDEEVDKLRKANFIEEIKYPEWLANVVMVKKNNGKLRMCVDFIDLNKSCPKDPYPLSNIDRLIDGASGYKTLSFMDAYSGYNQIKMSSTDSPHTTFMTNTCNFFYKVMPFGLKNAGATYQRLMDRVFQKQIGKNLEVYIDDMVVKTAKEGDQDGDLEEILKEVRRYNMRLNPAKCSFGVQAGKFLGFMLTSRGIEANPEKCQAIINMRSPTTVKECEEAFQKLKAFLASPPVLSRPKQGTPLTLYLAVSENAMSATLVQEVDGEEKPVYFISRIFRDAETRYQKIEKLSLAVIVTARRLRHYFQSHRIMVKTDYPIKQVLQKPDLAGRMVAWSIELSEFDIVFSPRGSIKSQVLTDFILEMTTPPEAISTQPWTLSVDGASNLRGSGAGVDLEDPGRVLIEQSLHFAFKASNNQAEYEALIAGMKLAKEMEVEDLRAKSDSQLVTNQVAGEYQTKDPQLMKYLEKVKSLAKQFKSFELVHVPRYQNSRADLLSKLASTKKPGNNRTVIQETISTLSTVASEMAFPLEQEDWRSPIIKYLKSDELPSEREKAIKIRKLAAHYPIMGDRLYKRGFSSPLLLCVGDHEAQTIIKEIHDGSCGNHIGARSLAGKVARAGYFWPTLFQDASRYVRSCDECQKHADIHHAPGEQLQSIMSPWPFYMWGVDIVGPFSTSQGQVKFLIVAVDYFTKWIEAEPMATISSEKEKGIRNTFVSVEHPQDNGQAESANKVILKALKRNLMRKGKSWAEHIPAILWSYHTTTHTSTGETPFKMVYGTDAMIPAEVNPPSWRRETLTAPNNDAALQENLDLLEEVREAAHLREFTAKQRARRKYDTKVIPRKFEAGDLVLKRPMGRDKGRKLAPNWEGPFRIQEVFGGGAYRLETLRGETFPRTWNVANLKYYFS
ncbi:hypothetical protein TSUD_149030 [Trifolium subterraneum]|uniref:Uncharacterized protein n=1 Tax=Trifolium subterraneum TaxID=3900 RepID=A0A2Z6MGL0_TRISU|nr:hypothetical protein TSUD_149030 [Trifolium subterraneum]